MLLDHDEGENKLLCFCLQILTAKHDSSSLIFKVFSLLLNIFELEMSLMTSQQHVSNSDIKYQVSIEPR